MPTRVLRLHPLQYAHVANKTTGTTQLLTGPLIHELSPEESLVGPPTDFFMLPHGWYCVVANPHRPADSPTRKSTTREAPHCFREVRFNVSAFPLYPGERVICLKPLEVLAADEALTVRVVGWQQQQQQHTSNSTEPAPRAPGEEYVVYGPRTYYPTVHERVVRRAKAVVVPPDCGLHLCATATFEDWSEGGRPVVRFQGERYLRLRSATGDGGLLYFAQQPREEVAQVVPGIRLGPSQGLHVCPSHEYTDTRPFAGRGGVRRETGRAFLVTGESCPLFVPHPYDSVVTPVSRIDVGPGEFCTVCRDCGGDGDGAAAAAAAGPSSEECRRVLSNTRFFLQPGERLEGGSGVRQPHLLLSSQALLLRALVDFDDSDEEAEGENTSTAPDVRRRCRRRRAAGEEWLVCGPRTCVPRSQVAIVPDPLTGADVRERLVLPDGCGVYVHSAATGVVRLVAGPRALLLGPGETLWRKPLSPEVRQCLAARLLEHGPYMWARSTAAATADCSRGVGDDGDTGGAGSTASAEHAADHHRPTFLPEGWRDYEAVVYHVPHRGVTQLYDAGTRASRVVFGPDRVMLAPSEDFTLVRLSGAVWDPAHLTRCLPKTPDHIRALYLFLGPSTMSDLVPVVTSDHARLELQLSYDWRFDVRRGDVAGARRCFSTSDFVGDTCAFIAAHIRAAVTTMPFEGFHTTIAQTLRGAVFGRDPVTGQARRELRFAASGLVVTSVDVQEVTVLDARAQQGLSEAAEGALERALRQREAEAQQAAAAQEQRTRGRLERRRVADEVRAERLRLRLRKEESRGLAVASRGKLTAAAAGAAEAAEIEGAAAVEVARARAEKEHVTAAAVAAVQEKKRRAESEHSAAMENTASEKTAALEEIRHTTFLELVDVLDADTVATLTDSHVARLLQCLGFADDDALLSMFHNPLNVLTASPPLRA